MTAKEKATILVNQHYNTMARLIIVTDGYSRSERHKKLFPIAKQCALIAVDEIVSTLEPMQLIFSDRELILKFWQDVKTEIEKL
jgi:hypothetical protein